MESNWEDLANAIILQAVKDYRRARKRTLRYKEAEKSWRTVKEIRRFFRSEWFKQLTTVSGEYLLNELEEDIRNERKGISGTGVSA